MKKVITIITSTILASSVMADFDKAYVGIGIGQSILTNGFKDEDPNEINLKDKKACNLIVNTFVGYSIKTGSIYESIEIFADLGKTIKKKAIFETGEDYGVSSKTIGYSFGAMTRIGYALDKSIIYVGIGASHNQHDLSNGICLRSRKILPIACLGYEQNISENYSFRVDLMKKFPLKKKFETIDIKTNYGLALKFSLVKYL